MWRTELVLLISVAALCAAHDDVLSGKSLLEASIDEQLDTRLAHDLKVDADAADLSDQSANVQAKARSKAEAFSHLKWGGHRHHRHHRHHSHTPTPTSTPTSAPTADPTDPPTASPTRAPTILPTATPSRAPTRWP